MEDNMEEKIENEINTIGAKINLIESITNALVTCLCGTSSLTEKDAYSFVYLLENKIKDLKIRQEKLIKELNI